MATTSSEGARQNWNGATGEADAHHRGYYLPGSVPGVEEAVGKEVGEAGWGRGCSQRDEMVRWTGPLRDTAIRKPDLMFRLRLVPGGYEQKLTGGLENQSGGDRLGNQYSSVEAARRAVSSDARVMRTILYSLQPSFTPTSLSVISLVRPFTYIRIVILTVSPGVVCLWMLAVLRQTSRSADQDQDDGKHWRW
ncbi:hypothetical protein CYLTODRAFT_415787 [Cylindrobasidium torrendii FP15055 ss-10]|uniref:Uncharacterized protein n=1 Tax=Cylindrobasidium torrendii FP15055 ss-10 TaxID=1314674 RepID=A0A0D7ARV2_9AGAR|nr:hypothetical protein CYLTODRAFT_415787 [Cylindrobasidium torrendii FP15055 ss-10]